MENHPIPQDVTGFQFKLIGQMTVKQFAFVGSGVALSYVSYLSPLPFVLRLILIGIFAGTGCALAFLPIDGRPLDAMLIHFFRAIFSPNQYIFEKVGGQFPTALLTKQANIPISESNEKRLQSYLRALPTPPKNDLDKKEQAFFSLLNPQPIPTTPPPPEKAKEEAPSPSGLPLEVPHVVAPTVVMPATALTQLHIAQPIVPLQPNIAPRETQERTTRAGDESRAGDKNEATTDMAHNKKQELISEQNETMPFIITMKIDNAATPAENKSEIKLPEIQPISNMRKIAQTSNVKTGVPRTPDVPNLITGIVKDPRGNVLPHMLIEIKDAEENPVRALKTNPLGQFASATPLPKGTYIISFEDPADAQKFDAISIDVVGEIIQPLEIFSIDKREELRKTLFAQNT